MWKFRGYRLILWWVLITKFSRSLLRAMWGLGKLACWSTWRTKNTIQIQHRQYLSIQQSMPCSWKTRQRWNYKSGTLQDSIPSRISSSPTSPGLTAAFSSSTLPIDRVSSISNRSGLWRRGSSAPKTPSSFSSPLNLTRQKQEQWAKTKLTR